MGICVKCNKPMIKIDGHYCLLSTLCLQNKIGDTPLHCAVVRGHKEVVKLLLEHGVNQNITNK